MYTADELRIIADKMDNPELGPYPRLVNDIATHHLTIYIRNSKNGHTPLKAREIIEDSATEEQAIIDLARAMQDYYINDLNPLKDHNSFYATILSQVLNIADWPELARELINTD
jgi:hypothetical protein